MQSQGGRGGVYCPLLGVERRSEGAWSCRSAVDATFIDFTVNQARRLRGGQWGHVPITI